MHYKIRFLFLLLLQTHKIDGGRILAIFGFPARTQYDFVEPLLQQLAQRGHNITVVATFAQREKIENFHDIVIKENDNIFNEFKNYTVNTIGPNHYDLLHAFYNKAYEMCINIFNNQHVRQLMENDSFDLVILDVFLSESLFGFAEYFRAPIIGVSSLGTMTSIDYLVGNTTPLSYIPDFLIQRPYNANMNFWLRCLNVAMFTLEWIHYNCKYMPVQKKIYQHNFPNATMTFEDAQKNFSLVLLNDHFTLSTPRPYVPNMIEVAGLHIPEKPDPNPGQLNRILDQAEHGVVYVDLDPMIPMDLVKLFLDEFRKIPQIVVWHMQLTLLTNIDIPANVHFRSNLSRHSVLSHTNIQLCICHGSYLELIESIHYGIPLLGIANIYGSNENYIDFIKKIVNGLSLRPNQLNAKSLSKALNDLLASDRYRREADVLSQRFRDQLNSPMEKAIFWIEYVLRHNGATQMRNLGQNLNIWEYYNLDVMGCLALVIICFIIFAYIVLNIVLRILRISQTKSVNAIEENISPAVV